MLLQLDGGKNPIVKVQFSLNSVSTGNQLDRRGDRTLFSTRFSAGSWRALRISLDLRVAASERPSLQHFFEFSVQILSLCVGALAAAAIVVATTLLYCDDDGGRWSSLLGITLHAHVTSTFISFDFCTLARVEPLNSVTWRGGKVSGVFYSNFEAIPESIK